MPQDPLQRLVSSGPHRQLSLCCKPYEGMKSCNYTVLVSGAEMLNASGVPRRRPVPMPRVPPVGGALPVHRVASESAMSQ